jgi:hypothetical protein
MKSEPGLPPTGTLSMRRSSIGANGWCALGAAAGMSISP